MAMVLWPRSAIPVAMFALVVVLPTPPLPDVMTTILDTGDLLPWSVSRATYPQIHQAAVAVR